MGAKQSTPFLGLTYSTNDKATMAILTGMQGVIAQIQAIGCTDIIPNMIAQVQTIPKSVKPISSNEMKQQYAQINAMFFGQGNPYMSDKYGLKQSLDNLFNIIIDNTTVNGVVDQDLTKKIVVNVLNSFCPTINTKSTFGESTFAFGGAGFFVIIILLILIFIWNLFGFMNPFTKKSIFY
jgi:hypothetical protein